jgi:hypothetical protein
VSTQPGKSSIHLDEQSLNLILQQFANQPGGPSMSYQGGRLFVDQGDLKLGLQGLSLQGTQLDVSHPKFGSLRVNLREIKLGPGGLDASLDLSPGS